MVIKSASYFCFDKFNEPYLKANHDTRSVSYYTYDGELIETFEYTINMPIKDYQVKLLDPEAPKPRVYKLQKKKFYNGKDIEQNTEVQYIMFLDKNENIIGSEVYNGSESPSRKDLEPYTDKYDLTTVPYYCWDNDGDIGPISEVKHPNCIIL
jgi:hypothetical protein